VPLALEQLLEVLLLVPHWYLLFLQLHLQCGAVVSLKSISLMCLVCIIWWTLFSVNPYCLFVHPLVLFFFS
jgi:hypothetical protein